MSPLAILQGADWRLVFQQQGDRIVHRIDVQSTSNWSVLAESVEGEASDWWPASPPLQSLHIESRSEGQVALLVGMAGRSHWSASIEISADGTEAIFDMACRASEAPAWLGCRYRTPAQKTAAQREISFHGLEPVPTRITRGEQGDVEICASAAGDDWPQTVRWRYAARVL